MPTMTPCRYLVLALVAFSSAEPQPALEGVIADVLRSEGAIKAQAPVPEASPTPEPLPTGEDDEEDAPKPLPSGDRRALAVINSARQEAGGAYSIPLDEGHRSRALSHDHGSHVCSNDCGPGPGNVGSITNDNYCDDGAPSTAFCADPTGTQYPCEAAVTSWCPFGHDCDDCGPRRVSNVCTCCAVRRGALPTPNRAHRIRC